MLVQFLVFSFCALAARGAILPMCDMACIDLYSPVCGSDGKTYSNGCYLSLANCGRPVESHVTVVSHSACGSVGAEVRAVADCPTICPEIYSPVCGSDGKVYSNHCFLNSAICLSGGTLTAGAGCSGGAVGI